MKNYLLVNRALAAEKNINYFNNLFSRVKEHSSPTVNRRSTDGQSQRQYSIGIWKYVAMMALLLTLACGQALGEDITITPTYNNNYATMPYGLVSVKGSVKSNSSGVYSAGSNGASYTLDFITTKSDMYIESVTFNSVSNGTLSSDDGTITSSVLTVSGSKDSVRVTMTSDSGKKGSLKITNIVVNTSSNDVETHTAFSVSSSTVSSTAKIDGSSVTSAVSMTTTGSASDGKLSIPNNGTITFTSSNNITYIAFFNPDNKILQSSQFQVNSTKLATGAWSGSAKSVEVSNKTGAARDISHIWVITEAAPAKDYTVTAATSTGDNTYGTVSAADATLDATETTTITATPATGYQVTNWAVSGTGASISPNGASNATSTTLTMGTANATVTATFGPKSYTVTLNNQSATTDGTESVTTTYNANTNLTSAITCPTKTSKVFAGYFTATNGGGVQLIDAAGNWIASAGGGSTYLDGSKNWKNDGNLTLYACWMEYASTFDIKAYVQSNLSSGSTTKTFTILGTNKLLYSLSGNTELDNSSDASNAYDGLKFKNSGDYILFLVQANSSLKLYFGYTDTKPKISINGGAESNVDVSSTGSKTADQEVDFGSETYDRLIKIRTVTSNAVVLQKIEITAVEETCPDAYSFTYKNSSLAWSDPLCFTNTETSDGNGGYFWTAQCTLPTDGVSFKLGWEGKDDAGNASTTEVDFSYMPYDLQRSKTFGVQPTSSNTGGAEGYLRVRSSYGDNNKYIGFIPSGYVLRTGSGESWSSTNFVPASEDYYETDWSTPLTTLSSSTADKHYYVGLKTSSGYVWSNAYSEDWSRLIFLQTKGSASSGWRKDGAKMQLHYWKNGGGGADAYVIMTDADGDGVYEAWLPNASYDRVQFKRLSSDEKSVYNETGNLELQSDKNMYIIEENFTETGWGVYEQSGKFNIYANSNDKNWYLRFKPHYVLTYDANGGSNTMDKQSVAIDALSKSVTVASNGFTAPTGYEFAGWNPDEAEADAGTIDGDYDPNDTPTMSDDVTLYAVWSPKTCTVSFDNNGGTGTITSVTATYDAAMPTKAGNLPEKTGYTFAGFWDGEGGTGNQYYNADGTSNANWDKNTTSATTLYAKWTANTPTITLDDQDATNTPTGSVVATYASAMPSIATLPEKTGYTFGGFYSDVAGGGTQYYTNTGASAKNSDLASATTLYALWTQSVTLDDNNGGEHNGSVSVTYKGTAGTPSAPTKTGYNVEGYYAEAGTTNKVMAANGTLVSDVTVSTVPWTNASSKWVHAGASTLYAKWTAKTTTITIDANTANHGSTTPGTVTATYASALPSFTAASGASGYSLTGYYTDATSGTKIINADGTLVASTSYTDGSGKWNSEVATLTLYAQYEAAAPAASCITWEGTPSSWTGDASPYTMTVSTNLSLKAVGKKWDINPSNSDYAKVWVEGGTEIKKTVIAIDDHAVGKYLQGSFADGSVIKSLTIGAANNSGTAGTNNNYVVMFSATEDFATVLADGSGNKAQVVSAPSYKDSYNASNLEKSITVPTGAKFFRIYRKIVGAGDSPWTIGDWTVPSDMGSSAKFRIFKIEACPEGSACTDPTIAWDNTPEDGLVGGSMTASVTSNYPAGVSYSSSDPTVASVNASTGAISYLKAGTTTITATVVGDGTTYCDLEDKVSQEITVTAVATGIAISPATIDVQVGGTTDLTATLTPAGAANATVNWTSEYTSNATVAIIGDNDKTARVTGVALRPSGEAFKIYAKTASLTANSWYATVRVYKGVTYDATTNEGSCATASAKYYGDAALVLPAATKDGYTFNGWYTTASGVGTKIGETGDEYTPSANSDTLYARFTENVSTYAITYELNSGTHGSTYSATGTPGTAHELSAPTRSGYTFVGWTVSPVVSGAKWGKTSSPDADITDASTLAVNGTSSVYFKNLAAANGAVTITAHWTQDCETSGGGGGSTTLFNVDFTDETTEQIKASTKEASWVAKTYDSYSMSFGSKNADAGVIDIINETGLRFTGNNLNNYNCLAIPLSLTKDKEVTAVITLGDATQIKYNWVSGALPASPNNGTSGSNYGTNNKINTLTYTPTSTGNYVLYLGRNGSESGKVVESIVITQAGGDPVVTPCYHVTYHANGAERGTVEDAARYEEDDLVTVKPNGFTKAGADFLGWATSESRADAGTIDYDPDDDENNSFTMGTADVDLWAVWGTAAPRVYSLTGSTYRCTSDDASTITLAGSETGVDYQLQKDGVDDGAPVSGTGSALNWSKTAWGTYTVVATRSVAVSVDMSGEVVLSDYPLSVTENLDGGTVAQDGEFTLSAKVSVNADNSDDYTYQWFSNDAANYDTPLSLGSATAMDASTGTQQFDYNPSTALGGTKYYFCEFKSPCNTVVRTRVVSVTVTTSTTTLTWDRDGEGDDFEYLPQGGKHTITVSSNSGVAPSLAVAGTDAEITNVEQEGSTTTATLILGASAADVVLTAEVSANGTYAAKSEDKEVIVKECSAGSETVLLSAHLSAYNAFTKDEGSGTATISNAGSDTHVTCSEKNYYKMVNGSTYYTFTLGGKEKFQAGDRIVFDVASSDQGNEKDFNIGLKASTSGSELHSLSTTLTTCDEKVFTIPAGSGLIDGNTVVITRASSENRVYGVSIVRGGGSGSSADVPSGIEWIVNPDPGHDQGSKAITRSISNDPFTYAVRATTPSMGTITYESSDEDVATVDANGRVTLIGEGTTTISAKQEAIGCYLASSTLSYSLTVESCTGEKEPVITYDGTVICPGDIQTLTATNYEDDATFQWYKDGAEIDGADEATYDADEAGTYTVVAHKDCYSESSNSVTLTKMSATVDVKTLADEFTIKSERPYNFRLFEIEDGATMTVQSRSGIDAENSVVTLSGNIISISGTAPTIASAGDATVVIRISRTACTSSYVDKTVTIHKIPATAKPTIAWIATKTTIKDKKEVAVKGVKDEVDADKSSDVDLYQELEKYYTVTARNCYWTTNEADLVKEYSQYDLIVLTDYPNSQTAPSGNDKSKSYTNAIGLLKDHIPMLTFEAYVAQCPNWEIPSNPKNTSETQNDITLLCNADEIFGTEGKFGAGQSITLSTVASGQALQGFLPADAPFVFMGSITDDATTYIACCERQVNPAARMLIFGLNANTMNNLTSDGKQMVHGFIDYLLISDAASIPDCSVIFNGGAGPADQNWNTTANWEGNTMPNQYASVRIDKPCVVSGGEMAEAGYLKIHTSSVGNTYTGKLTIEDDGVMAIQGTITRIEDSKYTLHLPTRPEDLIIKSTASGQGALIFDNESGTTQARVEMYTKAYYDGEKDHWQYVASPLISANRWSLGEWTYQFDNVSGEWDYYVDNFSAFKALALAQDETGTYVFEGTLAPTSNQKIAMPATNAIEGTSLIGNSWTAPIQIVNFQAEDFGNAKASVYIYETGYDPDGGPTNESGNSGERAAGKWYEIPVFGAATLVTSGGWAGMKVIPAMQAFEVKNKSGAPTTFTMNYERLVRNAVNDKNAARRAPQRAMASVETPTLRITMSDGEIRNDVYLLSGERFSEGYDNGWDGEYVGGNNCSQLYALSPIGNLSMSAQPEMEGTILGFAAGTKTEFTITFHYVGEEELYLNDMEAHRSTLISGENEYTFTAESGERGNRFVIGEQLFGAPEITTGVTDLDAENLDVQKVIYNDKLYIIRGGKVFSADGQLVK